MYMKSFAMSSRLSAIVDKYPFIFSLHAQTQALLSLVCCGFFLRIACCTVVFAIPNPGIGGVSISGFRFYKNWLKLYFLHVK